MKKVAPRQRAKLIARDRRRLRRRKLRSYDKALRAQISAIERTKNIARLRSENLIVTGDTIRYPIVLPAVFCFQSNYEESAKAIAELKKVGLEDGRPLMIRFDRVEKVDASALLVLAAEIYRCQKLRHFRSGKFVSGTYPANAEIYSHLRAIGFYRMIEAGEPLANIPRNEADKTRAYLHMRTDNYVDGALVNAFVAVIEEAAFPLSPIARGKLVGAIKEAMGNVEELSVVR